MIELKTVESAEHLVQARALLQEYGDTRRNDPALVDFKEEIKRLKNNNICGVKFQPDIQRFFPDDKDLTYRLYEELVRAGMKVMFHIGGEPLPSPKDRSKPHMIRNVALDFPELKIVGAHLAGLNVWDETYDMLAGLDNIYMESSLSYNFSFNSETIFTVRAGVLNLTNQKNVINRYYKVDPNNSEQAVQVNNLSLEMTPNVSLRIKF